MLGLPPAAPTVCASLRLKVPPAEPVSRQSPERADGRKTWDSAQDERYLECRYCGGKHFRVVYAHPTIGGRILGRRKCRHCGKGMTAWDRPIGN